MNFDEYADFTDETAIYPDSIREAVRRMSLAEGREYLELVYVTSKLNGEAGELSEHVGKMLRDDGGVLTKERCEAMRKEVGDVLYYVARIAKHLDSSLDMIAIENRIKLLDRKNRGVLHGSGDTR